MIQDLTKLKRTINFRPMLPRPSGFRTRVANYNSQKIGKANSLGEDPYKMDSIYGKTRLPRPNQNGWQPCPIQPAKGYYRLCLRVF